MFDNDIIIYPGTTFWQTPPDKRVLRVDTNVHPFIIVAFFREPSILYY